MSKTLPCKQCGTESPRGSKTCPSCGIQYPHVTKKVQLIGFSVLILVILFFVAVFTSETLVYDKGTAHSYEVTQINENNSSGRAKYTFYIHSPNAQSLEDRARTVTEATIELQKKYKADTVVTRITSGKDIESPVVAEAIYIPDRKGYSGKDSSKRWRITSTDQSPTEVEDRIRLLWYANQKNFIETKVHALNNGNTYTDTNYLNEEKLKEFIANKLKISQSDVQLIAFFPKVVYED